MQESQTEAPRYATLAEQRDAWMQQRLAETKANPPMPPGLQDVFPLVDQTIGEQRDKGLRKYGQPLRTFIGRKPKRDRLTEQIDDIHYLAQDILQEELIKSALTEAYGQISVGGLKAAQELIVDALLMMDDRPPVSGRIPMPAEVAR